MSTSCRIAAALFAVVAVAAVPSVSLGAAATVSGDFTFGSSVMPIVSGSGRLDILLFNGNAVGNPTGFPDANGTMPGGGSTFTGDYAVAGDPETMTVGELLDWLHTYRGDSFNTLEVELDVNEPGNAQKHPLTIDLFAVDIGGTTFSTAGAVVLDAPDNGSGISDFVISSGIDLTAFATSDVITFHLEASDLDGGFEEFFISAGDGPPPPPVPEPATMGLLGLGLGVMAVRRKKT